MRILYGVCGMGMGHATRSDVAISHLLSRGHDVLVAASGSAFKFLGERFPGRVTESAGPDMKTTDGKLDLREMLNQGVKRLPEILIKNAKAWGDAQDFAPNACVTDHDGFSRLFAKAHGLGLVSLDNSQVIARCLHDPGLVSDHLTGLRTLAQRTFAKIPDADFYVITSFFYPAIRPELTRSTILIPPILRRAILRALGAGTRGVRRAREQERPVLVYKSLASSSEDSRLLASLARLPTEKFTLYGFPPGVETPRNCEARKIDPDAFVRDLAGCKAILSNAGMSLIGEALALGKPVYAVPIQEQYEQVLNALYLDKLGFGRMSDRFDERTLASFLGNLPAYTARIAETPQHDGNSLLGQTLDRLFPADTSFARPRVPVGREAARLGG